LFHVAYVINKRFISELQVFDWVNNHPFSNQ
jgi:hypothetical protein